MNGSGFVAALAANLTDERSKTLAVDRERAVALARAVLRRDDMMLTAAEAKLMSRQLLRALGEPPF